MRKPRKPGPYPNRLAECRLAIEKDFAELLDRIEAAGWRRPEALAVLGDLADSFALADAADAEIAAQVEALFRRR